ncbi:hypothetical protein EVAR_92950_1 [Eumeta japonica]|uniref:Uncharacterized protein n=1 Tax=Eumeta variegata TaxID=151549 RepID=A0A4C1TAC8_EUMVA|nr:hypothetical protein EVAR_92950_1 [Eumeta japonica]
MVSSTNPSVRDLCVRQGGPRQRRASGCPSSTGVGRLVRVELALVSMSCGVRREVATSAGSRLRTNVCGTGEIKASRPNRRAV